jgi:hypothetical protein
MFRRFPALPDEARKLSLSTGPFVKELLPMRPVCLQVASALSLAILAILPVNAAETLKKPDIVKSISFLENKGQASPGVLWMTQGPNYRATFFKDSFVLQTVRRMPTAHDPNESSDVESRPITSTAEALAGDPAAKSAPQNVLVEEQRIEFAGANPLADIEPLDERPGKVSFFEGNDPNRWVKGASTYARLRYKNIYPGIDLIFYGKEGKLEYDFVVAAGADPSLIRMKIQGKDAGSITEKGELRLGEVVHRPQLYQNLDRGKRLVEGSFVALTGDTIGFKFATYDKTKTLVIDPTINLLYSTYAGGIHNDQALGMTVDAQGNTYLTGWAASEDFPVTGNALQATRMNLGVYLYDVVVMKFDPSGTLQYSTFLGGTQNDQGGPIVANADGSVYIGGFTQSSDFPVTSNAYQKAWGGGADAFLAKISSDGSQLLYSTYLGATGDEAITSMILNADGSLWMSGVASQAGLPASSNAFQNKPNGIDNSFIAKAQFDISGNLQLPYLTFIGGSQSGQTNGPGEGWPSNLALDTAGNVYFAGTTQSSDYPVTANAYEPPVTLSHGCDNSPHPNSIGVLTKFSPDLSQMLYSTYFGGKTEDQIGFPYCNQGISSIHLDPKGDIWLYGYTGESDLPVSSNAISSQLNGNGNANGQDAFLAELSSDGTKLIYGTYFGGSQLDGATSMVFDASGNIWLSGSSNSTNFPTTTDALQPQNTGGGYDFTLAKLSPDGTTILYSTFIGGTADNGFGEMLMALDTSGNVHLSGSTSSAGFPVTPNAFQQVFANGDSGPDGNDIFFAELGTGTISTVGPSTGGNSGDTSITVSGAGFQIGATCSLVLNGVTIPSASSSVSPTGTNITCAFSLNGAGAGIYNVVVANPSGGASFTKSGAFTVTSGGGPQIWANIVGRPKIRTGVPSVVTVNYGNSGNTDAYMVGMEIDLPPSVTATYDVGVSPSLSSGLQVGSSATTSAGTRIPLIIPHLAAGESQSYQIAVTDATNNDSYTLSTQLGAPWYSSLSQATSELTAQSNTLTPAAACEPALPASPNVVNCLGLYLSQYRAGGATVAQAQSLAGTLLTELQQSLVGTTPVVSAGTAASPNSAYVNTTLVVTGLPSTDDTELVHDFGTSTQYSFPIDTSHCVVWADNINDAIGGVLYKCTYTVPSPIANGELFTGNSYSRLNLLTNPGNLIPQFDTCWTKAFNVTGSGTELDVHAGTPCGLQGDVAPPDDPCVEPGGCDPPPPPDPIIQKPIGGTTGSAIDPNAKIGSNGDGSTSHFISASAPIPYAVYFENEATASLPAAAVVVTDQLDGTKVDLTTLSIGSISFGTTVIKPPTGSNTYSTTYNINSSLSVRIQGSLDQSTGLLKWTFQSIDPSTGLPPSDTTIGFLPPDTNGIIGQASVVFNVMPKAGQTTGSQITNAATVTFDTNPPILTPTWLNTVDVDPPASKITALPADETTTFTVSWSGTDKGSGIASYNIYVSDNGSAFTLWQSAVTTTSASYIGTLGHTYGFYSIATDGAANIEAAKSTADTTTDVTGSVTLGATTTTLVASATTATAGTNLTFTATVAASPGSGTPTGTVTFMDGTATLGLGTLNASGQASSATSLLAAGGHSITAVYPGDSNFASSTSSAVTVTIQADFGISLSSTSGSATAGKSVMTAISITPSGGFNQQVSFSCSGLPAGATCSFSPATVTPNGSAAQTTLTIQTSQQQSFLQPESNPHAAMTLALLGGGLLCFGSFFRKRKWGLNLTLLCLIVAGVVGCGGSSTPKTTTSTITVTATAGSATHSATYTLTVQ